MSRFMRVMNKFPALLLRSPLHGLISGSVLLITFTGRKSGKKYTTPITYLRDVAINAAVIKVEHFEMGSYRGLVTGAQQMGQDEKKKGPEPLI